MTTLGQTSFSSGEGISSYIQGIDHVELYVSNAKQAAHYYQTAFGFLPIAYAGLETGLHDKMSYILQQDKCYLVITSPLKSESQPSQYLKIHGDGVRDIAFRVSDVIKVFNACIENGAIALLEPTIFEDNAGRVIKATVSSFGDVVHSFIQRDDLNRTFWPTYHPLKPLTTPWTGLHMYDHFAISVPYGELQQWVKFYMQIFSFHQIHEEGIATEYSAMNSVAVQDSTDTIKFVLIEPVPGKRKSQVEEYLKFNEGPGVQHIALHTQNIVRTIYALQDNGVGFVRAPSSYYEMLPERIGVIHEDLTSLKETNVLVDRDDWGYLLQIFSQPLQPRPTLFMEIIQRHDARGFGSGNIQALFKALEREQERRGNL